MANNKEIFYASLDKSKSVFVIDPNKVLVTDHTLGETRVEDRYVPQEELIMYAGLKAYRSGKSSVFDSESQPTVVDLGELKINLLNPLKNENEYKNFFTTQWTDVFADQRDADVFIDPETFGIKSIEITQNASLVPRITIDFIDVRGKTLMERGDDDNNPYNLFYSLPYPTFMLTIKGFYGKAITYPLVLLKTSTSFDPSSGSYNIRCEFLSRTFAIFNDFLLVYGMVASYMFEISKDGQSTYQGMEVLRYLYESQNAKIIKDASAAGLNINSPEVQMRLIDRPITLYDLINAGSLISEDDLVNFSDPAIKNKFDARAIMDEAKHLFDSSYDYLTKFISEDFTQFGLKPEGDFYTYTRSGSRIHNSPDFMTGISDVNNHYEKYIATSTNPIIAGIDRKIKDAIKQAGITLKQGKILDVSNIEVNKAGKGFVLSLTTMDTIFLKISEVFTAQYKEQSDSVIQKQREVVKAKIGFDMTIENVVRIMLNNMQTFLMLLNLTTKRSFLQIKKQPTRRAAQMRDAEYVRENGKEKMYPWPNFYVLDNSKDGSHQRAYPGVKITNRVWPEVSFVEELYKSLDRIKILSAPEEAVPAKPTTLMTGFLNQAAMEQYGTISRVETSLEVIKKIALTLVHNGVQFKNLGDGNIDKIANSLVSYDYLTLLEKVKGLPSSRMSIELNFIYDHLLKADDQYSDLFGKMLGKVSNVKGFTDLIKAEQAAFLTKDQEKLKAATKQFYDNKGQPNWITDKNSYISQLMLGLLKEADPMEYVNPSTSSAGTRSSEISSRTSQNNNNYVAAIFPGYEMSENKHPLDEKFEINTINLALGYQNTNAEKVLFKNDAINASGGNVNIEVNGVRALVINNKVPPTETDKTFQRKYNNY